MNLEKEMKDVIAKKLEDGTIEKAIEKYLEKGIEESISDLFGYCGACTKVIENNVKSMLVPYLENYDFSKYIVKVDHVMTEILKQTTVENTKLLSNFKKLMTPSFEGDSIKASELFDKWANYVENNVDTSNLDVEHDDEVSYQYVNIKYEFVENESRSWSKMRSGKIIFECEEDQNINFEIEVYRFDSVHRGDIWRFDFSKVLTLDSLRDLDEFSVFIISLIQSGVDIEIDTTYDENGVRPSATPDVYFA